jgi:hypothetical protein
MNSVDIDIATFQGAVFDATTKWPQHFEPEKHGAIRII